MHDAVLLALLLLRFTRRAPFTLQQRNNMHDAVLLALLLLPITRRAPFTRQQGR